MKVKVCGITTVEQLEALPAAGSDLAGLIFVQRSKRYAREKLRPFRQQLRKLPIEKVGVFVNSSEEEILQTAEDFGLSMIQLHGDEDVSLTQRINRILPVIKVFRLPSPGLKEQMEEHRDACSYFLFDTRGKDLGGNGEKFDWASIHGLTGDQPCFLSGGIAPTDAAALKDLNNRNPLFGVDINSRFESSPGIKDLRAVAEFISQVKDQSK